MKVRYIRKGFGHEVGDVINTTSKVANTLLRREICEVFEEKSAAEQAAAEQRQHAQRGKQQGANGIGSQYIH